jgi:hypothetical protein
MLDLTPSGDHAFAPGPDNKKQTQDQNATTSAADKSSDASEGSTGADSGTPPPSAAKGPIELTSYEQAIVLLSDKIGRARIAAALTASSNQPQMRVLGWVTVGISAAATLLVTIKSSMSSPSPESSSIPADSSKGTWITWLRNRALWPSRSGMRRFIFVFVGFLAMILSAVATALTSVKQFYDPITAYKSSEVALLGLRGLHDQVSLDFVRTWDASKCAQVLGDKELAADDRWRSELQNREGTLQNLEAAVIAASANLQDADISRSAGNGKAAEPSGRVPPTDRTGGQAGSPASPR